MMKLIFVYNANSGKLNALFDIGHKILSPESYKCNLCSLTHGNFKERNVWKYFRKSSDLDLTFIHKDEFEDQYKGEYSYPIILKYNGELNVFISTRELNKISKPEELIELINVRAKRLASLGGSEKDLKNIPRRKHSNASSEPRGFGAV